MLPSCGYDDPLGAYSTRCAAALLGWEVQYAAKTRLCVQVGADGAGMDVLCLQLSDVLHLRLSGVLCLRLSFSHQERLLGEEVAGCTGVLLLLIAA